MKIVDAIAHAITAEQVDTAFCVPDEVTIHIGHALKELGVRVVRGRHEQNVVTMADGHARATGAPAVCAVGHGPALAQIGTGLMTAARRRSPVLVLVPQSDSGRGNVKEFDARRFAEGLGARYVAMRGASWVAEDVHEAFRLVRLRQGPVVLTVPQIPDIEAELTGPWQYEPAPDIYLRLAEPDPESDAIDEVAGILAWARKPVIVAGRGAVLSGARSQMVALADRLGALLATSLQARELFRGHPHNIGMIGAYGTDAAVELLAEADCILAVGVALNAYQTGGGTLAANARVIQIDSDPARIGAIARADSVIVSDATPAVRAINRALEAADLPQSSVWFADTMRDRVAAATKPAPKAPPAEPDASGRMSTTTVLRALEELLPSDRIVIADVGDFVLYTIDEVSVPDPASWVWTADFGSIGLGLAVGLGTAVARPDRHCVLFAGDGGFMMNAQELETAARERIPLTMIVLDDCAYRPEVRFMEALGKPGDMGLFDEVDFAAVARAFGIPAVTVRTLEDLGAAKDLIRHRHGPVLIDAKVSGLETHRSFAAYEPGSLIPVAAKP
ncbi:MAG: thiamine pyrophosphate-binding protein [Solirubrobacteraceae bacterium]|nr:thiamine pyrophosphate-binding protein [Solirubrobacteraceae bacterium]